MAAAPSSATSAAAIATIAARGAPIHARGELLFAIEIARDQKVGDVDRRDQQHQQRRGLHQSKERRGELVLFTAQRKRVEAAVAIGERVIARQPGRDRFELGACLRLRSPPREAPDRRDSLSLAFPALRRRERYRYPCVDAGGITVFGADHAGDERAASVQRHLAADDVCSAEPADPQPPADHDEGVAAGLVRAGRKRRAGDRRDPERLEEVRGHCRRLDTFGIGAGAGHDHRDRPPRRQRGERGSSRADVEEVRRCERAALMRTFARARIADEHQLLQVRI
jgi:hypothetical protein